MKKALLGLILSISVALGCSVLTSQKVVDDIEPAGACIATQVLAGGVEDPLAIVSACVGTTVQDVVQVVETLLAQQAPTNDGGPSTAALSPLQAKLLRILAKAVALR
jgi:hypothetical protein